MIWNPINVGGKLPRNGEQVLVTDGKMWGVAFFYKGPVDMPYFNSLEFDTDEIKAWARVDSPVKIKSKPGAPLDNA